MQSMLVNGHEIDQLVYQGIPVVTYEQIALVHQVPVANIHKTFQRHKAEFREGEDYFALDFAEVASLGLRVQANSNGLTLFTEDGYLLLVKPMRDKVSWQVQRMMRDAYFRDQAHQVEPQSSGEVDRLAAIVGFAYQKLDRKIDSIEQNTRARLEDEQRANDTRFKRIEALEAHRVERLEAIEHTVEAMATVAAGPSPSVMVNTVDDFVANRLSMLGLRPYTKPKVFVAAFKAYMRSHYACQSQCGEEIYAQEDLLEAYTTAGFGTRENRHLAGDDRLLAEHDLFLDCVSRKRQQQGARPRFPRSVKSPLLYKPQSEDEGA